MIQIKPGAVTSGHQSEQKPLKVQCVILVEIYCTYPCLYGQQKYQTAPFKGSESAGGKNTNKKIQKGQNSVFPFSQQSRLFTNEKFGPPNILFQQSEQCACINIRYRIISYVNKSVYIQYMVYPAIHLCRLNVIRVKAYTSCFRHKHQLHDYGQLTFFFFFFYTL